MQSTTRCAPKIWGTAIINTVKVFFYHPQAIVLWTILIPLFAIPFAFSPRQNPIPYQVFSVHNSTDDSTTTHVIRNLELNYPYIESKDQIVPGSVLGPIVIVGPLAGHWLFWAFTGIPPEFVDTLGFMHAFALSTGLNHFANGALKCYVGRLRPYFYDECGFDDATLSCTKEKEAEHARRSFPSGHSSSSATAFGFLTLYFLGKVQPSAPPKYYMINERWRFDLTDVKIIGSLLPFVCAVWIACSRLVDKDHHPSDIIWGCMQGMLISFLFYMRYFHSPFSSAMDGRKYLAGEARAKPDSILMEGNILQDSVIVTGPDQGGYDMNDLGSSKADTSENM